jgi:hypothetical protein
MQAVSSVLLPQARGAGERAALGRNAQLKKEHSRQERSYTVCLVHLTFPYGHSFPRHPVHCYAFRGPQFRETFLQQQIVSNFWLVQRKHRDAFRSRANVDEESIPVINTDGFTLCHMHTLFILGRMVCFHGNWDACDKYIEHIDCYIVKGV